MGFLGILEDNKLPHVPATVTLDQPTDQGDTPVTALKHGNGRFANIALARQPSDDLHDPLNWSQVKQVNAIMIISARIVLLLVAASTGAFSAAFSRKSATKTYNGLLAARIIQGGSTPAQEGIILSTIGDLFLVHEQGLYMAIVQSTLGAISMFANAITGPITTNLGWKWLFHLCIVFTGLQTLLFNREHRLNIDETVGGELVVQGQAAEDNVTHVEESKSKVTTTQEYRTTPAKKAHIQTLAVFTGTYAPENLLQLIIAPLQFVQIFADSGSLSSPAPSRRPTWLNLLPWLRFSHLRHIYLLPLG
ncbi:hypothetical protein LTR93_011845 [Exophiala xenobiotica]|nr:hypothetical protein LTR93_011845 [Exophiala xenobiotica]